MQDDHRPQCTYVSEGEEDQELLENLEALDPCGEYDDVEFSNRVQNFLEKYEKEIRKEARAPQNWEPTPISPTSQAKTSGTWSHWTSNQVNRIFRPKFRGGEKKHGPI